MSNEEVEVCAICKDAVYLVRCEICGRMVCQWCIDFLLLKRGDVK